MRTTSSSQSKFLNIASRICLRTSTQKFVHHRELSQPEMVDADAIISFVVNAVENGEHRTKLGMINHITLDPAALRRLIPATATHSMWLDSDVINTYISILDKRMGQDVWLFNSFFHEYVISEINADSARRQWQRCQQANKNIIMIPINEAALHWSVLIIHRARKEMCVYGSSNDFAHSFVTHMKRLNGLKQLRSRSTTQSWNEEIENFSVVTSIGLPKIHQHDGYNCGAIMLLHMELIGLGISQPQAFATSHLEQYRLCILLQICKEIWESKI
jgi:hypothetical protein